MVLPISPASARATISELPPGAKGTTSRKGLVGQVSAAAIHGVSAASDADVWASQWRRVRGALGLEFMGRRGTQISHRPGILPERFASGRQADTNRLHGGLIIGAFPLFVPLQRVGCATECDTSVVFKS